MAYIFGGICGEAELILKVLGSKGKILSGSLWIFFQGFGESNALFSGIKGAQPPPPLRASSVVAKKSGFGEQRKITFRELMYFLSGIEESNALFSGIKGAQTPLGGLISGRKKFHI